MLLVAVAVVWGAQTVRKAERSSGNDLVGYLAASEALYGGGDPYHLPGPFPYIYPLFLATVIRPLAALPVPAASVLWFLLEAACLLFVLRGARLRFARGELTGAAAIAVLVAVYGDVLQIEFLNGQVNLLVLALIVAASAGTLGAAIALKLTPALMLVYWTVARRLGLVLQAMAWAAAFILLPWLVAGNRVWTLYRSYIDEFLLARTGALDPTQITFSVYGIFGTLTGIAPSRPVILALALIVVGAIVAWHVWRQAGARSAHVAWVYLAATPLLNPMSEVHHLTATIPLAAATAGEAHRRDVAVALGAFVVLLWMGRLDRRGPWYFLAILALLAAGMMAIRTDPEQD